MSFLNARIPFGLIVAIFSGMVAMPVVAAEKTTAERPNILFIAVDDLRPELGCYGQDYVHSPNIDRLAAQGVVFRRAYCQQAICGPSRASLMNGMRPDSLGVLQNYQYFRETSPDVITLPQHFRMHGYETLYIGKVFHGQFVDEEHSWSRKPKRAPQSPDLPVRGYQLPSSWKIIAENTEKMVAKYGPQIKRTGLVSKPVTEDADIPDAGYPDGYNAECAVLTLRELAQSDRPFFFGVGFHKPHLPFVAPKRYWDLYDPDKLPLAAIQEKPQNAPSLGLHASFELRTREGVPKYGPIDEPLARHLKHGYLACVSYVDAQIGKLLDELDRLGLRENTIIVLWGDHGWHLGDYGIWGKATNYEVATRVPLIVSPPGGRDGAVSDSLVELEDIYPTLCEMAGLPLPDQLDGQSFAACVDNPQSPARRWALSQFPCPALREWAACPLSPEMRETWFGPLIRDIEHQLAAESPRFSRELYETYVTGYALRTDRYRLVLWVDVRDRFGPPIAVELYDHAVDPMESVNVSGKPEYKDVVSKLTNELYTYWHATEKRWRHGLEFVEP